MYSRLLANTTSAVGLTRVANASKMTAHALPGVGGAFSTGAKRSLSKSSATSSHTADSYKKDDFDPTPPKDSSIFRVDATKGEVTKNTEPPSGQDTRAGPSTPEYETADNNYATKEGQPQLRYGGKEELRKQSGSETSKAGEGPEDGSKGGMR